MAFYLKHFQHTINLRFGLFLLVCAMVSYEKLYAQNGISFVADANHQKRYHIMSGPDSFALFWFDDTLRKPYLHQIFSPGQQLITRGYPLLTRANDTTDHPHQVGIWLNYEDVNGTDFWNNSAWPAANRKGVLGAIVIDSITQVTAGNPALLSYTARWKDKNGIPVLKEETTYFFRSEKQLRIIDRTTTLTALMPVTFSDVKDGVYGIRLCRALQVPFAGETSGASGRYISSEGFTDTAVWGKPAKWVVLTGKIQHEKVSVLMTDHPQNIGYPGYWHARGYGLFALNSFAQKAFQPQMAAKQFQLSANKSFTLKYRVAISSEKKGMSTKDAAQLAVEFARMQ